MAMSASVRQQHSANQHDIEEMEADELIQDFQSVDDLAGAGINVREIELLKSQMGLHCVEDIIHTPLKRLTETKGITEAKAEKIQTAARSICKTSVRVGLQSARELFAEEEDRHFQISTGSKELDDILGGGITSGDLTEIYGEFRTGKSQLMYTLAVQAQLSTEHGGANGKAIFIDTEGSFKPERFKPIADRFSISPDAAMEYIMCAKPATCDMFVRMIQVELPAVLAAHKNIKILLIDSLMALFRTEFVGRGQLADRQALIGKLLSHLKRLAQNYNIGIVYTNQVMSTPDAAATMGAPIVKACGGHIVSHNTTTRIQFKKGRDTARKAKIVDAPHLREAEAEFYITSGGINDSPED